MEEVPGSEESLLALGEQPALTGQDEEGSRFASSIVDAALARLRTVTLIPSCANSIGDSPYSLANQQAAPLVSVEADSGSGTLTTNQPSVRKARRRWTVRAVVAVAAVAVASASAQAAVYWGNYGSNGSGTTIGRANLNGSKPSQRFITKAAGPVGIAVDRKYLYWSDTLNSSCGGTTIGRAKIDGSAPNPNFIKGASCAHGIAVSGSFIYWANRGPNGTGTSTRPR